MPFQRIPNTAQVDVVFLLFGQRVENVYYVQVAGGIDAAALADIRDIFAGWVGNTWMANISVDCSWIGLEVRNWDIEAGSILAFAPPVVVNGGIPVNSEPGNVSFALSLRTATAGRSFRGRKYVAGMPTTQRVGNVVQPAWVTDLLTALNALRDALDGINAVLVVVSKILDGVARLEALATPIISFTATDFFIDSQRRRLTGRGT